MAKQVITAVKKHSTKKRKVTPGRRVTGYLPEALEKRLRLRCVRESCSLSDAMVRAITLWLEAGNGFKA